MDIVKQLPVLIPELCTYVFGPRSDQNIDRLQEYMDRLSNFYDGSKEEERGEDHLRYKSLWRAAYVYQYMLYGIAAFRLRIFWLRDELAAISLYLFFLNSLTFSRGIETSAEVAVTCIAGGPGTDIFSIIAAQDWIFPDSQPSRLQFHIFDRAAMEWKQRLDRLLTRVSHLYFDYTYHDLKLPLSGQERDLVSIRFRDTVNIVENKNQSV